MGTTCLFFNLLFKSLKFPEGGGGVSGGISGSGVLGCGWGLLFFTLLSFTLLCELIPEETPVISELTFLAWFPSEETPPACWLLPELTE